MLILYALQIEAMRLQAELDELRNSHSEASARSEALTALQAKYDTAAAQLAALEGADDRAAQLTAENDKLRERLEKTEGQVWPDTCVWLALTNVYSPGLLLLVVDGVGSARLPAMSTAYCCGISYACVLRSLGGAGEPQH